mgnify:CR=1 FL=1
MKITYKTIKNTKQIDKPNEDIVFCDLDKKIFILLDGVSRDNINGKYPNPSPAAEVANILKNEIYKNLLLIDEKNDNILNAIFTSLKNANNEVRLYNESANLQFASGAVGIVAMIDKEMFYYAYIGDCYGRLIYKDKSITFTECQTKKISQHKKEYTSYEIREIICNNIEHPYAYGVLNGDERACQFIVLDKINLSKVKQIILSSDGMEDFLSKCSVNLLKSNNAVELLERAIVDNNEKQDDRTIIKIELEEGNG